MQIRLPTYGSGQQSWTFDLASRKTPPSNDKEYRPTGQEEKTVEQGDVLTNLLNLEFNIMNTCRSSLIDDLVAPELTLERRTTQSEFKEMMESKITQPAEKLNTRIYWKTEESPIATIENREDDHSLLFVQSGLKRATRASWCQLRMMKRLKEPTMLQWFRWTRVQPW